jgi:uncharacterized protein YehS (DUF1456 family)
MMNNNVLKRIRYISDYSDSKMISLFKLGALTVTREEVSNWLKQEGDLDYKECTDIYLSAFLNGLIIDKRGKREGEQPKPEKKLNNNLILRKITIAFNLKSEDTLELLKLVDFRLSKPELSALFRKNDHKHYRECKDQILRNVLHGLQIKIRP